MDVLLYLVGTVVCALLGAAAMRSRHRVVGNEPRCGKCQYDLTGVEAKHCPECGHELKPGAVHRGLRTVPPSWRIGGVVMLVAAASLAAVGARRANERLATDWYGARPDFIVVRDLHDADALKREYAADALARRLEADSIGPGTMDDAVAAVAKWNTPAMRATRRDGKLNRSTAQLLIAGRFNQTQELEALQSLCSNRAKLNHGLVNIFSDLAVPKPGPGQALLIRVRAVHVGGGEAGGDKLLMDRAGFSGTSYDGWRGQHIWPAERLISANPATIEITTDLYVVESDLYEIRDGALRSPEAIEGMKVTELTASDLTRLLVSDVQRVVLTDAGKAPPAEMGAEVEPRAER